MSNNSEEQITQNVLESIAQTSNPRLKTVMTSLIRHLHAFTREVELTQEEWALAIEFLTRTGQMCDDKRQEFILLSDTLGVSMLVDAINHRKAGEATESTVFGPLHLGIGSSRPAPDEVDLPQRPLVGRECNRALAAPAPRGPAGKEQGQAHQGAAHPGDERPP